MKKHLTLFVIFICLTVPAWAQGGVRQVSAFTKHQPFNAGEVIVKFKNTPANFAVATKSDVSVSEFSKKTRPSVKKLFKKGSHKYHPEVLGVDPTNDKIDAPGIYKLTYPGRDDVFNLVDELKKNPDVEYAEPNYLYQTSIIPNDPYFSVKWALSKIGAPAAWDITQGSDSVVIAVIDTGVDYNHPALASNIWTNVDEIPGNGIDDDGNGYIDDVRGWDFVTVPSDWVIPGEDPGPQDNDPMDFHGHGTHVSGIALGVARNCTIMPLRAGYQYSDGNGYLELADIAEAIRYAADNGANVINMSFGSEYDSFLMKDAVDYANEKGSVMVAASGNVDSSCAGQRFYPAAYDHVIAVSSVDDEDHISVWNLAAFSNFGDFVDISAPGTNILSTLPKGSYGYASGTSMATPFVSGVAALIKSKHPEMDPEQIEARIKSTSDNIYLVNNQTFLAGKLGAGRVNAKRALGNLSIAITYPKPNSILSGSVAVIGSASIEAFKSYKLEYCTYSATDEWQPIVDSSTRPVENGLLAIWSIANPENYYKLRVTVTNASNEAYQYVSSVSFGADGEAKLLAKPKCGPSPYDPNRGQFLFYYDLLEASDVDLYVYNTTGTMVWQRSIPYDGSGTAGAGGSAGPNRVFWNGVDGFGGQIGNGAYLYMIVANDKGERKIIGRGKFAVVRS